MRGRAMELFDTHAHYDAEQFDPDRDDVLAALPGAGVALVVNPGCDLPSSEAALALAAKWPFLYAAVGYHPENCAPYREEDLDTIRDMARRDKCVAIGEIGLDYYWEENPPREGKTEPLVPVQRETQDHQSTRAVR